LPAGGLADLGELVVLDVVDAVLDGAREGAAFGDGDDGVEPGVA
jgi:hypothetical protein